MILVYVFLIVIFSLLLIKSADWVIIAIRRLSRQTHTKAFALSAVVLAIGTSLPELFVGVTAALEGQPQIALGTTMGSNIVNITLVVGLAAFVVGRVGVHGNFLKRDVWIALVAGVLPMLLLLDGALSRVDGLILLTVYAAYATSFFKTRFTQIAKEQQEEKSYVYRFIRKFNHVDTKKRKEIGRLFVGLALLLFSADVIVKSSTALAEYAGISGFVIGLIVVAVGTSLPELAFSLRSLEDHEPSMFFGNILGSTIANSTLVIGLVAIISPIQVINTGKYLTAAAFFVVVFLVFWLFIRSKHRLDRWEAGVLILLYVVFVIAVLV